MMNICAVSFHCCPFSLLGGDGTGGMNVYLREFCSVIESFPDTKIDVFTRIQNPRIGGIKSFSPQARVIHLKGGPERPIDRTQLHDSLPEFTHNLESFIIRNKEKYDVIYRACGRRNKAVIQPPIGSHFPHSYLYEEESS